MKVIISKAMYFTSVVISIPLIFMVMAYLGKSPILFAISFTIYVILDCARNVIIMKIAEKLK